MQVLTFHSVSDFNIAGGSTNPEQVLNNWHSIVNNASVINTGFIVLEHDLFQQSVDIATGYILPDALAHQPAFKIEPIISCLGEPLSNAYIETNNNATNPISGKQTSSVLTAVTTMPTSDSTGSSTASADGSQSSSGSSGDASNGALSSFAAPGSLVAMGLALVSGMTAVVL